MRLRSTHFTVHGIARPAGSKRAFAFQGKDGRLHATVTDANPKSKDWKAQVALAAKAAHEGELFAGPLHVSMTFIVLRPLSHYRRNGSLTARAPKHPVTRPDLLKLARAVEDAMTGVVYRDDSLIVNEHLAKHYGAEAKTVITVLELHEPYPLLRDQH